MVIKSYEDLEIYKESYKLAMKLYRESLKFPKFELYEEGSQVRRSSRSITTNIVEGFGRRRYKNEFIKYLTYAHASCDETKVHLNFIFDCGYISKTDFQSYIRDYKYLGSKIYNFIKSVEQSHIPRI